jgi:hypothetical protein
MCLMNFVILSTARVLYTASEMEKDEIGILLIKLNSRILEAWKLLMHLEKRWLLISVHISTLLPRGREDSPLADVRVFAFCAAESVITVDHTAVCTPVAARNEDRAAHRTSRTFSQSEKDKDSLYWHHRSYLINSQHESVTHRKGIS